MPTKLNDFTAEEIHQRRLEIAEKERIKEEHKAKFVRPCEECGDNIYMRPDQKFCSAGCRVKNYNKQKASNTEILLAEISRLETRVQELEEELGGRK